jgi:hypothetical protein
VAVINIGVSVRPRNLHTAVREGAGVGLLLEGGMVFNPNDALIEELPIDLAGQLAR